MKTYSHPIHRTARRDEENGGFEFTYEDGWVVLVDDDGSVYVQNPENDVLGNSYDVEDTGRCGGASVPPLVIDEAVRERERMWGSSGARFSE